MNKEILDFIENNSPGGGFLQSENWRKFQEAWGRKTQNILASDDQGEPIAFANLITHTLPLVGDYFYIPRGPVIKISNFQFPISNKIPNTKSQFVNFLEDLTSLAKKEDIGWIRIEPNSEEDLKLIKENLPAELKMKKAPVDMQPSEVLILDITKNEEELLAGMKQKTRYNIRLAEKRGVRISHNMEHITRNINEFLRLVKITSRRDKIASHPEGYYRKMLKVIPNDILKLYVAEYEGKIIAVNLVLFFGKTAAYMHGTSDNLHRDVMAPYLLQWQAILDAKKSGCEKYDFGGIKSQGTKGKSWAGITKFKTGFAPETSPIKFPGCYDIILGPSRYNLYRFAQKAKRFIR